MRELGDDVGLEPFVHDEVAVAGDGTVLVVDPRRVLPSVLHRRAPDLQSEELLAAEERVLFCTGKKQEDFSDASEF